MVFLLFFFFILGTAVGSFANVVVDRTTKGGSILSPLRSYCDHCGAKLATVDLVPILSFVGLRGRCRYCHHKLSWQYPLVETLLGVLFALTFYSLVARGTFSIPLVFYHFLVISVLVVVAVVDLKFSLIPTTFVFAASLIVLFWNYFQMSSSNFVTSVFSAFLLAFFFAAIVFLTRGRGMGSGDIPLVFLLGLFLGWPENLLAVFGAFLSGAIVALTLLLFGKKRLGQTIPFGPFLIASSIVVFYWGSQIIVWYWGLI